MSERDVSQGDWEILDQLSGPGFHAPAYVADLRRQRDEWRDRYAAKALEADALRKERDSARSEQPSGESEYLASRLEDLSADEQSRGRHNADPRSAPTQEGILFCVQLRRHKEDGWLVEVRLHDAPRYPLTVGPFSKEPAQEIAARIYTALSGVAAQPQAPEPERIGGDHMRGLYERTRQSQSAFRAVDRSRFSSPAVLEAVLRYMVPRPAGPKGEQP